jgi:peroxiredoxin
MTIFVLIGLVPWVVVVFLGWLLYLMVRQQGRVLLSQEELRTRLANAETAVQGLGGRLATAEQTAARAHAAQAAAQPAAAPSPAQGALTLGTAAPDFRLPDLKGRFHTLADYKGKPSVFLFFNPDCGFCTQLAPRLRDLPESAPQVVVMTRGNKEANKKIARENGWNVDVLLEPNWEVATSYRTNATPTAYLIDAEGRIASSLGVGVDGVMQLTRMLNGGGNGHGDDGHDLTAESLRAKQDAAIEKARSAGMAVTQSNIKRDGLAAGTVAPSFTLPDLEGREHSLADLRGKRVLLVFSDPGCGPCQLLAPALEQLYETHHGNNLEVFMVSRGNLEANRQKAAEHRLKFPVVLQKGWEVSKDYAMFATPVAYLIDERGVILHDVAVGADAIMRLASAS